MFRLLALFHELYLRTSPLDIAASFWMTLTLMSGRSFLLPQFLASSPWLPPAFHNAPLLQYSARHYTLPQPAPGLWGGPHRQVVSE